MSRKFGMTFLNNSAVIGTLFFAQNSSYNLSRIPIRAADFNYCILRFQLRGHSTITWTEFCHFLTQSLRGQFLYPEHGQKQTFFDPFPPHLVHVVIEWPLIWIPHSTAALYTFSCHYVVALKLFFFSSSILNYWLTKKRLSSHKSWSVGMYKSTKNVWVVWSITMVYFVSFNIILVPILVFFIFMS